VVVGQSGEKQEFSRLLSVVMPSFAGRQLYIPYSGSAVFLKCSIFFPDLKMPIVSLQLTFRERLREDAFKTGFLEPSGGYPGIRVADTIFRPGKKEKYF
jgi:hypothetical protein